MRWITSQDVTSAGNEGADGAQTQHDAIHDVSNPPEGNSAQCMAPVSSMFSSVIQRSSCSKKVKGNLSSVNAIGKQFSSCLKPL